VLVSLPAPYSKPSLNLEPNKNLKPGDLVAVTCHASRGYPAATVLWQDGHGGNITENVTTSQVANEEGLFDVHSVLQVSVEPSSTYSCVVRNPVLQQEAQASVTITGKSPGGRHTPTPGAARRGALGHRGTRRLHPGAARGPGLRVPQENPPELRGGGGQRR
ncbi:CD276 protein, partial [Crypturellus undulatus]|nr:CD276 protein [Crypturellus undulatus]